MSCTDIPAVVLAVDEASKVVVAVKAVLTITVIAADVLLLNIVSPPYTAVSVCVPFASAEVGYVATPEVSVAVPSSVVPS